MAATSTESASAQWQIGLSNDNVKERYNDIISQINSTLDKVSQIKCWQRLACFLVTLGASEADGASSKSSEQLKQLAFNHYER